MIMLELELLDDKGKATEKKHQQLLLLEFSNVQITKYPPQCSTKKKEQQFDVDVLSAAQSTSNQIEREVPADSIRWAICGYACRAFALKEVMSAAAELAKKLQAVINAYEQRNDGELRGQLDQMTGAAEPLNEALKRLELAKHDRSPGRPANMPMALFIADMAVLYTELTGKWAGINKGDNAKGDYDGGPFARFSYEAYRLAVTTVAPNKAPADSAASWAEAIADWLPLVRMYHKALDEQEAYYEEAAKTAHLDWPEIAPKSTKS